VDFPDADGLTGEDRAEVNCFAAQTDSAAFCRLQLCRKNTGWREEIRHDKMFTSNRFLARYALPPEAGERYFPGPTRRHD